MNIHHVISHRYFSSVFKGFDPSKFFTLAQKNPFCRLLLCVPVPYLFSFVQNFYGALLHKTPLNSENLTPLSNICLLPTNDLCNAKFEGQLTSTRTLHCKKNGRVCKSGNRDTSTVPYFLTEKLS